jgi:sulfatase maturation enzyme AslB (radical SAM superfamily)
LNFIELRNSKNLKFPLVRVSFIELEDNKDEIEDFENYWSSKVDAINFQKLTDYKDKVISFEEIDSPIRCNMSNFRLAIKSDGNVRQCCVGYGEKILIGNVYESSLIKIWQSETFKNFQKMHT